MSTQTESPSIALDYVKTIGIVNNGFNGRGFANPYDIVVDGGGRIFVLNRCDPLRASAIRVGVCTLDEEYLNEFGRGNGAGDGQFVWPVAMAVAEAAESVIPEGLLVVVLPCMGSFCISSPSGVPVSA